MQQAKQNEKDRARMTAEKPETGDGAPDEPVLAGVGFLSLKSAQFWSSCSRVLPILDHLVYCPHRRMPIHDLTGKVALVTGLGCIGEGWGSGTTIAALFAR